MQWRLKARLTLPFSGYGKYGLKVVEIPTDPVTGIDLNYLEQAIPKFDIRRACL